MKLTFFRWSTQEDDSARYVMLSLRVSLAQNDRIIDELASMPLRKPLRPLSLL